MSQIKVSTHKDCEGNTLISASFNDLFIRNVADFIAERVVNQLASVIAMKIWKERKEELMKNIDIHGIVVQAMAKTEEKLTKKVQELQRPNIETRTVYQSGPRSLWEFLGL